jgi:hypothetical protein
MNVKTNAEMLPAMQRFKRLRDRLRLMWQASSGLLRLIVDRSVSSLSGLSPSECRSGCSMGIQ